MRRATSLPALTLLVTACASAASPSSAASQDHAQSPALADLAFMAGCWNGTFTSRGREGVIEEHYTAPSANVMLGTTRYLIGERAVQFELTTIRTTDDGHVVLQPYPGGTRSPATFRLTSTTSTGAGPGAVFEAPEHDFPKRIVYRLVEGRLVARIDGGEGSDQAQEWEMRSAPCVTEPAPSPRSRAAPDRRREAPRPATPSASAPAAPTGPRR